MEQRFLMDTNIVIDAMGNIMPDQTKKFVAGLTPIVSSVTYMETLGWHKASSLQLAPLQRFMGIATILPIDQEVIEKTVIIRQEKKIGLGDAIIAATAIVHNLTLVTRNTSDFKSIAELRVVNPWPVV